MRRRRGPGSLDSSRTFLYRDSKPGDYDGAGCLRLLNGLTARHNDLLMRKLAELLRAHPGVVIVYVDYYGEALDIKPERFTGCSERGTRRSQREFWLMAEMIASKCMLGYSPEFLHDDLPKKTVPVGKFRLPKFKLAFESNIAPAMKRLGLHLPFDDVKANMSDMLLEEELRGVYVNRVVHKAVIEMNEEGSEAAAITVESDDDMGY
ncbi:hypothetical protein ACP4OV_014950 [Aristida adscensionis]